MDVRDLALKCEVSNYDVVFWWAGCELKGDVLLVPNRAVGSFIGNCWGQQARVFIPTLTIRVVPPPEKAKPSPLNAKGRKWEQQRQASQTRLDME